MWEKAITPSNFLEGYQGSGLWPLDPAAVHLIIDNGTSIVGVILDDISDVEPEPGCSSYSNEIPTISEVIQVIKEFLNPEETPQSIPDCSLQQGLLLLVMNSIRG